MRCNRIVWLFALACFLGDLVADEPIDSGGFEIITVDSFEGMRIVETYVNTVLPPGASVNSNDTIVTATGGAETSVKISSAFDQHQEPGLLIEVSDGDVTIDFSGWPSQQSGLYAPLTLTTCPDPDDPSYPVKYSCSTFRAKFVDIGVFVPLTNIRVDGVVGARIPGDGSKLSESFGVSYNRIYFVREIEAAKLGSSCEFYASCSGEPVLLVHGYQTEPVGPILADNGGRDYWGSFPERLMVDGYVPYEFAWLSNARFEDVAADLKQTIELIKTETGHDVHIVAHSFGGVLTRRLLQDSSLNAVAGSIASVSTIGSPHSGIFDRQENYLEIEFPQGQDSALFEGCGQISCHVMGENAFGSTIASLLEFELIAGSEPYFLASTTSSLPDVNILSLIGFLRNHLAPNHTLGGDGLITGEGQRFHPELVLTLAGEPKWDGTLFESAIGAALVSEFFLGRDATSDADPFLEPNSIAVPADFVAFRHSSGTPVGPALYEFSEPLVPFSGFNDIYQRVVERIEASQSQSQLYSVTDLGMLAGGINGSDAYAINNFGIVVGTSDGIADENYTGGGRGRATKPFIWTAGEGMLALGPTPTYAGLNAAGGNAFGINDDGAVVGTLNYGFAGGFQSFISIPTSGMELIPASGVAYDINNAGQVVGTGGQSAYRWTAMGGLESLGIIVQNTAAVAINELGVVAGSHGIESCNTRPQIWNAAGQPQSNIDLSGLLATLPPYSAICNGRAYGINDAGDVVGSLYFIFIEEPAKTVAFKWSSMSNSTQGLGDLPQMPGTIGNEAFGINNDGMVVGQSGNQAFLWTPQTGILDLNALLDESGGGWTLHIARAINDAGEIVGYGLHDGQMRAFLLTPIGDQ